MAKRKQKLQNICWTIHCHVAAIKMLSLFDQQQRSNRQLRKFLFLAMATVLNAGWGCERRPIQASWFNLVLWYQRRYKCNLLSQLQTQYKSSERKISQKNNEYMPSHSLLCCYIAANKIWANFWFIIKQQLAIKNILSNGSHLEWRLWLSNTILKGKHLCQAFSPVVLEEKV